LARAGAGGDDEKFGHRGAAAEVEDDDVFAAGIGGKFRGLDGELASVAAALNCNFFTRSNDKSSRTGAVEIKKPPLFYPLADT
jgi:hypothetical protein